MKYLLFLLIVLSFSYSCSNEIEVLDRNTTKLSFAPISLNVEWVYELDSIIFDLGGAQIDTFKSFIKESLQDLEINEVGDSLLTLNRFYKKDSTDSWKQIDTWKVIKTSSNFQRIEENLRFIKLIFPFEKGDTWDGNAFIPSDLEILVSGESLIPYLNWEYRITDDEGIFTLNDISIDNIVTVDQVDSDNNIYRRFSREKYASNIGLVEKELIILETQCIADCIGQTWEEKAQKGFILNQKLINFNN